MRSRVLGLFTLAVAVSLVAAACGGGGGPSNEASGSPSESASAAPSASASAGGGGTIKVPGESVPANNHGSEDVSGKGSLNMEADDFYFDPTVLSGSAGQKLKITIDNEGSATHNFTLSQQGISQDVSPGDEITVTVTFPQSGVLSFHCRFHENLGMIGELSLS
jgi:plastocyanin